MTRTSIILKLSLAAMAISIFAKVSVGQVLGEAEGVRLISPDSGHRGQITALYWADFNRDGHQDAFALTAGTAVLLGNDGAGSLVDVTEQLGLDLPVAVVGVDWGDLDSDGWLDLLVVGRSGECKVWKSEEGLGFQLLPGGAGLSDLDDVLAASWLDFDADGVMDLHIVRKTDHLIMRGVGGGLFEEVTIDLPSHSLVTGIGQAQPSGSHPGSEDSLADAGGSKGNQATSSPGTRSASSGGGAAPTLSGGSSTSGGSANVQTPSCVFSIEDMATTNCVAASSIPTLGMLYPLGPEFSIDASTGHVKFGGGTYAFKLNVDGDIAANQGSRIGFDDGNGILHSYLAHQNNDTVLSTGGGGRDLVLETTNSVGVPVERVRIGALSDNPDITIPNGQVGIGTATPDARLDVVGGEIHVHGSYGLRTFRASDGALGLEIGTGSGANTVRFLDGGVARSEISADANGTTWDLQSGNLTVIGGDLVVGTTTPFAAAGIYVDAGTANERGLYVRSWSGVPAIDGLTLAGDSPGVRGANIGNGPGIGVEGYSDSGNGGIGVLGRVIDKNGFKGEMYGVKGVVDEGSADSAGVFGKGPIRGVKGEAQFGNGVEGITTSRIGGGHGVHGSSASPNGYGVYSDGRLGVNGNAELTGDLIAARVETDGFQLNANPADGHVLTSDGTGEGSWQLLPAGIGGLGTVNQLARFSGPGSITDSTITESFGKIGIGAAVGGGRLLVDAAGLTSAIKGLATTGVAIEGTATTGTGIKGTSMDSNGVYGTSTNGIGVRAASQNGTAVVAYAGDNDEFAGSYGVKGQSSNGLGAGVSGVHLSPGGDGVGVEGLTISTLGTGVHGWGTDSSAGGSSMGVHGTSAAGQGTGVLGEASNPTGTAIGVRGASASDSGTGVYGEASDVTGTTYGVYGKVTSSAGYGVYSEGKLGVAGDIEGGNVVASGDVTATGDVTASGLMQAGSMVTGTLRISSNPTDGHVLTSNAGGTATWQNPTIPGYGTFLQIPVFNGAGQLGDSPLSTSMGNVGLGGSPPSALGPKLFVNKGSVAGALSSTAYTIATFRRGAGSGEGSTIDILSHPTGSSAISFGHDAQSRAGQLEFSNSQERFAFKFPSDNNSKVGISESYFSVGSSSSGSRMNSIQYAPDDDGSTPWMTLRGGAAVSANVGLRILDTGVTAGSENVVELSHSGPGGVSSPLSATIRSRSLGQDAIDGVELSLRASGPYNNPGTNAELILRADGTVDVLGDLAVDGWSYLSAMSTTQLLATGTGRIQGDFDVDGRTDLNGDAYVQGTTVLHGDTTVNADLTVQGAVLFANAPGSSQTVTEIRQEGTGALVRGYIGGSLEYQVTNTGRVVCNAIEIRGGGDLVEAFDSPEGQVDPGTVMVIDPEHPGQLVPCSEPYDSKVAGATSGACGVSHGIKLSQEGVLDGDILLAMSGRVYLKCTAANGAIKPGDLLTTASLKGHAMKATDRSRAMGAVIGKAMTCLDSGTGHVLVLVNLQ
ncbi:MAG: hypothetical protein ACI9F9_000380 [Candidatus Paceibacteria bacterium]|jgi:hypothetical protein